MDGQTKLASCPRCGAQGADAYHMLWSCPCLFDNPLPEVVATQALLDRAGQEVDASPCFWLRGLVPSSWTVPHTPPAPRLALRMVGNDFPQPCLWPNGTYATDGSGGEHSSFPTLRRCGAGIAYVEGNSVPWGAFVCLPGLVQTVPRAELYAITLVLHNTVGKVAVWTDSRVCCQLFA